VPKPPVAGVVVDEFPTLAHALGWFAAERAVLAAAVDRAATLSAGYAWQLARTLSTYLDLSGHWDDLAATQRIAVEAAAECRDVTAEADAHRRLARAYTRLHRGDDAHLELLRALDLYGVAGDTIGQGHVHLSLALMRERQSRYADALDHARRGLETFMSIGDVHGLARARNSVGWYHTLLGDHHEALVQCGQALDILKDFDDRIALAATWDSIGYAHHHLGEYAPAVDAFLQAVRLYRDVGDRHLEAFVLSHLGDAYAADGRTEAADAVWRVALEAFERYDPPEAEKLRARISPAIQSSSSHQCEYDR
jgi:tetratricopeptide (TPR) repeat protein